MCDRLGDGEDSGTEIPDDVDDIDAKRYLLKYIQKMRKNDLFR